VGIDFSSPDGAVEFTRVMAGRGVPVVSGTTGLSDSHRAALADASKGAAVLWAPNMSVGVYCLHELAALAQRMLGAAYDAEIVEVHHRHKRDAPSGTALSLGRRLAEVGLEVVTGRDGDVGPRAPGELGILAVRGGEVVGEHTVMFLGDADRIEITHRASSRMVFAQGAVTLARRLVGRPAGLYRVSDLF